MATPPIARLTVTGLTSIRELSLELKTPVTVLIGANGSGKSNIVKSFDLLGAVIDRRLQHYVAQRGGFARFVHRTGDVAGNARHVALRVEGEPNADGLMNGYQAMLSPGQDDEPMLHETLLMHDTSKYPRPYEQRIGVARESQLGKLPDPREAAFARHVLSVLSGCKVFHFDDVSPDAPSKRQSLISDNLELARDASNIAAYLYRLKEEEPSAYRSIVDAIRAIAPFFEDFVLIPQGVEKDSLLLRWRQVDNPTVFAASQLSDGTLRFICLATLLLSPHRPATIVLDEPELGLHPFAIHLLGELLRIAARDGHRVILATQSTDLLGEFELEEIAVVERRDGCTHVSRPARAQLDNFLDSYSVSEMWEMNLFGGRPAAESFGSS